MPTRTEPLAAPGAGSRAIGLVRIAGITLLTASALVLAVMLGVRFVLFPQVASHRLDIAAMLSRELGAKVEIDTIRTGWQGWNPELVVGGFRVLDAAADATQPLIELPEVTGIVSWTSLLTADLRLRELVIDRPRLAVRRDADGRIHVGGLLVDAARPTSAPRLTDWVLRQRLIVVRDALLVWEDAMRNAPQLVLDGVQFRLENRLGQHRFGLRGTPPPEIAAPIDVRGEFSAASVADWRSATGRFYLRLDFADVAAWSEWIPLPVDLQSGQGAMRLWLEFAGGAARDVVADLELAHVRTRLAPDLPPLDLARLAGRVTWHHEGTQRALATRGLAFVERGGIAIEPTNLDLRYETGPDGRAASGRFAANRVELQPLAQLAANLPLPAQIRDALARHAPQGTLNDVDYAWQGPFASPSSFKAQALFAGLGAKPFDGWPGFSGLSGRVDATHAAGTLQLSGRNAMLALPKALAEPVALDTASARMRWERREDELSLRFEDVQVANAQIAGSGQGTWRSARKGPGDIDVTARLSRADVKHVHRYLPVAMEAETRAWLRDALTAGTIDGAAMTLKGDLARFPFPDGKSGTFLLTIDVRDTAFEYAAGWPALAAVDAQIRFEGHALGMTASRARVLGATLGRMKATIPDLSRTYPVLALEGEASGPTSEFLAFIAATPIGAWIDHAADHVTATGNGKLDFRYETALGQEEGSPKVHGTYQFTDNKLKIPGAPALSGVNGSLAFTEQEVTARDIAVEALGGHARVSITSRNQTLNLDAAGNAALAAVHQEFETPLAARFTGSTDWRLALEARDGFSAWTLESTLRGAAIDLPRPAGKTPSEAVPLRVERRAIGKDGKRDAITVQYGTAGRVVAQRRLDATGATVDRALVLLGKAAVPGAAPDRAGVTIRGDVEALSVDDWLAVVDEAAPSGAAQGNAPLELESVELAAGALVALGRGYDAVTLSANRAAQRWKLRFNARQLDGTAEWEPAGSKLANGRLTAKLAKLDFASLRDAPTSEPRPAPARREGSANPWPELDVHAEHFIARAGDLGRMELLARPEGTDWRVTRFALINDAGRITADGGWQLAGRQQQTRFDVDIETANTAAFLVRFGFPGDVKGGRARLAGAIDWPGSPTDFDYDKLSGTFHVDVGSGQFTKMDPGVGKLLGVLSLQALPRRISLDFRDVFSEGFAFDTIAGNVNITKGVMRTQDLQVIGPAAKVVLAGNVDLSKETQQLSVRVQPSLSTVVSTGAGAAAVALLAANPLVGAVVGAGTLIAQKIMQDPIEQMFSYEYSVRGSWSDPVVERVATRPLQRLGEAPKGAAVEK